MPTYFDGSGSSSGTGTGLTPTAVNGASHTAASGELCQVNYSATGACAITLPATGMVAVTDSGNKCVTNHITITPPTGDSINFGAANAALVLGTGAFADNGLSITLTRNAVTSNWEVS